jgi:hypothetical protein
MAQDSIPSNLAAVNAPAQTAQPTIYADAQENQAPVKDEVVDQPVVDSTLPQVYTCNETNIKEEDTDPKQILLHGDRC